MLAAPANQPSGGDAIWPIGLLLAMVLFYAIMLSGNRKQKKQRQQMLAAVKKNDRVLTIGGIIGTVINVRDGEVVLKIDETNNVKMTVVRGSIQRVLGEGEAPAEVA